MTGAAPVFIGFLVVQRLAELLYARRNTARLMARGAVEHGAAHYPLIVLLHAAWIGSIAFWGRDAEIRPAWLALFVVLQVLRLWILATLGRRWTTRIIVIDEPLVRRGPFAIVPHPNYGLVVAEIVVAPMVLGLWGVALIFTGLNAAVLAIRIRAENRALAPLR